MDMTVKGNYSIIKIENNLTTDTETNAFKDFVQKAIDDGAYYIIFDFSKIREINSNGIGKILLFYKKLKEYNGTIGFVNLSDSIRDLFEKLMFFNLFKEYKSEADIED